MRLFRPLRDMSRRVESLAGGDLESPIGHQGRSDEIGLVARALARLREQLAVRQKSLDDDQAQAYEAKLRRQEEINQLVSLFGKSMGGVFSGVSRASVGMSDASTALERTSLDTQERMGHALTHGDESVSSAQAVASASEELAISIAEISRQVGQSSRISEAAMDRAVAAVG